ncbi:hypothetical protein GQX74_004124 [Glossina fuscipes]|nr:hypothetical protein GQX74_004124 [Glossina fuscipes]
MMIISHTDIHSIHQREHTNIPTDDDNGAGGGHCVTYTDGSFLSSSFQCLGVTLAESYKFVGVVVKCNFIKRANATNDQQNKWTTTTLMHLNTRTSITKSKGCLSLSFVLQRLQ